MNLSQTPDAVLNRGGWFAQPQGGATFIQGLYTATPSDRNIFAVAAAPYVLTLPPALQVPQGFYLLTKKIDNNANAITITTSGIDKIDGATTYALSAQWQYVVLTSDGVNNWFISGVGTT